MLAINTSSKLKIRAKRFFVVLVSVIFAIGFERKAIAQNLFFKNPFGSKSADKTVSDIPHPAVVRIVVSEGNMASLGSGSLVYKNDTYGIIVTNWHVVRSAKQGALVHFPDGTQLQGKILLTDENWDLAAVQIPSPKVEPLKITTLPAQLGEKLWIAGYGSGKFALQAGNCTEYMAPEANWPPELVELSATARQGDSGGPIINSKGEIAGVLFGQGGGCTLGSYGGRVMEFLSRVPAPNAQRGESIAMAIKQTTSGSSQLNNIASSVATNPQTEISRNANPNFNPTDLQHPRDNRYWNAASSGRQVYASHPNLASQPNSQTVSKSNQLAANNSQINSNGVSNLSPIHSVTTPNPKVTRQVSVPIGAGNAIPNSTLPSTPSIAMNSPTSQSQTLATQSLGSANAPILKWQDFFGRTLFEQLKSALAGIGIFFLLWKACGLMTKTTQEN